MATIPDKFHDLIHVKKTFAHLATVMTDGSPQVTPVWFDEAGGKIRINTARGRVKDRNLKPGVRVALSIIDPDDPYRYVQIRGTVVSETEEAQPLISIRWRRSTSIETNIRSTIPRTRA